MNMVSRPKRRKQQLNKGDRHPNVEKTNIASSSPYFLWFMDKFETVQEHVEYHQECVREMLEMYKQMTHETFMEIITIGQRKWMSMDKFDNEYSQTGLRFLARLVVSNHPNDPENKISNSTLEWISKRTSRNVIIRQYICYFINYMLRYGKILNVPIDADSIINHMLIFMDDKYTSVRVQAVSVLLNFQDHQNAMEALLEHWSCDPSNPVRRLIAKSIRFTDQSVLHIFERLRDTDEIVRSEVYSKLAAYDIKMLTIAQRRWILNLGCSEKSSKVQAIITDQLMMNWFENLNNSHLAFLKAIKYDANEEDIQCFIRLSKYVLFNFFEKCLKFGQTEKLYEELRLMTVGKFINCVPFNHLTLEMCIFWWILMQFFHQHNNDQDTLDKIMCDVDTLCRYIQTFITHTKAISSDDLISEQNRRKVQILVEILYEQEIDEYGRVTLINFVSQILTNETELLNETTIARLVKCVAKGVQSNALVRYFLDIFDGICGKVPLIDPKIDEIIKMVSNIDAKISIAQLKSQIMELKEDENDVINQCNYTKLCGVRNQMKQLRLQIINICRDFGTFDFEPDINLDEHELSTKDTIKCLQIYFYSCHLMQQIRVPPEMTLFYANFIYQRSDDENFDVRGWALKCNASLALNFNHAVYTALEISYKQLIVHSDPDIWSIAITTICELLDKHRCKFDVPSSEDDVVNVVDIIFHLMLNIKHETLKNAMIIGLGRLILSQYITDPKQIAQYFLGYFDPNAFDSSQQLFGPFFNKLVNLKRQSCLVSALLPTFEIISKGEAEKEYHKIKCNDIIAMVKTLTAPVPPNTTSKLHNQIAIEITKLLLHGYGYSVKVANVMIDQLEKLKIEVNDEFKREIRVPLSNLLDELVGQPKQRIQAIWRQLGFKKTDRTARRSSIPIALDSPLESVQENSLALALSSTITNERATQNPNKKHSRTQRAETATTRKAFGDRTNN